MRRPLAILISSLFFLSQISASAQHSAMEDGLKKFSPEGPAIKPEDIRDRAAKSSVYINVGGSIGTGWFVAPAWVVTNHHVIMNGTDGFVEVQGPYKGGKNCKISRIVADDPVHDLAIVEIRYATIATASPGLPGGKINDILKPKGEIQSAIDDAEKTVADQKTQAFQGRLVDDIPALPLSDQSAREGAVVYEFGNPRGYKGTWTAGVVSAYRDGNELHGKFKIEDLAKKKGIHGSAPIDETRGGDVVQYSTPSSHGSSGSALLNDRGKVIAVCFAGDEEGHDLNFATSVKYVKELLTRARSGL